MPAKNFFKVFQGAALDFPIEILLVHSGMVKLERAAGLRVKGVEVLKILVGESSGLSVK
ncbi:hypothetical protein KEJ25_06910 [Candidatus Bathyarchaeota archaeon]|nr:hypothetical protein [Candidatus Bathyarchaeota archaeon]